jgi:uncharacterized membrane protein
MSRVLGSYNLKVYLSAMIKLMKHLSFRHAAVGLLTVLLIVSTIIILSKSTGNQFFYGGAIAGALIGIILIDSWRKIYGWKDTLFIFIISYVLITLMLLLGFYYGWPFGFFRYTGLLGYELNNIVPWIVPIVWAVLIAAALPLVRGRKRFKPKDRSRLFTWAFDTAVLVTLMDIVMEPALVAAGLKQFLPGLGIYGVPFQHFLGFFIVTFLVTAIIIARIHRHSAFPSVTRFFTTSVALLLLFFAVLSGTLQLPFTFILGILLAVWLLWKQQQTDNL